MPTFKKDVRAVAGGNLSNLTLISERVLANFSPAELQHAFVQFKIMAHMHDKRLKQPDPNPLYKTSDLAILDGINQIMKAYFLKYKLIDMRHGRLNWTRYLSFLRENVVSLALRQDNPDTLAFKTWDVIIGGHYLTTQMQQEIMRLRTEYEANPTSRREYPNFIHLYMEAVKLISEGVNPSYGHTDDDHLIAAIKGVALVLDPRNRWWSHIRRMNKYDMRTLCENHGLSVRVNRLPSERYFKMKHLPVVDAIEFVLENPTNFDLSEGNLFARNLHQKHGIDITNNWILGGLYCVSHLCTTDPLTPNEDVVERVIYVPIRHLRIIYIPTVDDEGNEVDEEEDDSTYKIYIGTGIGEYDMGTPEQKQAWDDIFQPYSFVYTEISVITPGAFLDDRNRAGIGMKYLVQNYDMMADMRKPIYVSREDVTRLLDHVGMGVCLFNDAGLSPFSSHPPPTIHTSLYPGSVLLQGKLPALATVYSARSITYDHDDTIAPDLITAIDHAYHA